MLCCVPTLVTVLSGRSLRCAACAAAGVNDPPTATTAGLSNPTTVADTSSITLRASVADVDGGSLAVTCTDGAATSTLTHPASIAVSGTPTTFSLTYAPGSIEAASVSRAVSCSFSDGVAAPLAVSFGSINITNGGAVGGALAAA